MQGQEGAGIRRGYPGLEEKMFTGIVEEIGEILNIERGSQSAVLHIRCRTVLAVSYTHLTLPTKLEV